MEVKLLKNIRYGNQESNKVGESINIDKDDLQEFIDKGIIKESYLEELEDEAIEQPITDEVNDTNVVIYNDITKAEIIEILIEYGIEHDPKDAKRVLYDLMLGSD